MRHPLPKFLLDEHISPAVAEALRKAGIDARAVAGTPQAGQSDRAQAVLAADEGRILVTYDTADFAPLLVDLAREGRPLPGIVFVDERSLRTSDIPGLSRALTRLAEKIARGEVDPAGGLFLRKT